MTLQEFLDKHSGWVSVERVSCGTYEGKLRWSHNSFDTGDELCSVWVAPGTSMGASMSELDRVASKARVPA